MAKKFFLFFFIACFFAFPLTGAHATDIGLSAGALLPYSQFQDVADTGFSLGYHAKTDVQEVFRYGMAVNYGSATGNRGVDFWEIDLYPFIDWVFLRTEHVDFFTRGGIGLFHWESDNIWWLDGSGFGMTTTFGAGCTITKNVEVLASVNKLYASFNVDYFLIRVGYNFDIGE